MSFEIIRRNSRARFTEVHTNLAHITSTEPKTPQDETSIQTKILRGLYYVHLYAALEKAINEVVENTLILINSKQITNKHYTTTFNAISLNNKMMAFKNAGYKEYIAKSIAIFRAIDSDESSDINNTLLTTSLQNVWHKTIQETLECFGIPSIDFGPQVRYTIDEIVNNRNAVAHGRETPANIGERHRSDILRKKTQEIQQVVDLIIDAFESFISNKNYLKSEHTNQYE
ncbi:MAE_28990/MAE_18760 family HEPN-like nuclease [Chromobacterium sphagni]|uniref:MAE_28990/MAE_18760 family HEPN-like nuclease n=1 Tax=Chromobacterium sphagni TaxID=1903179 RepID=UPI000AB7871D|nr:MAE_28990/MAE_18760 family HEPN-like nuclease [Chromobacterium sphagni]